MAIRYRSGLKRDFIDFAMANYCASNSRTATSYCRALDVLSNAIQMSGLSVAGENDVWRILSTSELMKLYDFTIQETRKYLKDGSGLFSRATLGGKSYIKNWWCSSALKALAAFRSSESYEEKLDEVLTKANDGSEISDLARSVELADPRPFISDDIDVHSREGREKIVEVRQRINQSVFRRWTLSNYNQECCVTGINVPQLLRASHISAWALDERNRMNPENGLCLSATYDAAFDRHLISFDDDLRMVLSKCIRDYCTKEVCRSYFLSYEGVKIKMPVKYVPDRVLLAAHRDRLVK